MEILFWMIDVPTLGGLVVLGVFGTVLTLYFFMLRWINAGGQESEG